jgi:hypothetical protein
MKRSSNRSDVNQVEVMEKYVRAPFPGVGHEAEAPESGGNSVSMKRGGNMFSGWKEKCQTGCHRAS